MNGKIIIANWKMNFSKNDSIKFMEKFSEKIYNNKIIIAPPYHLLDIVKNYLVSINNNMINLAAQNSSHFADFGPHTGEISAKMLKDIGCDYILVGHSERRKLGESDEIISQKIANILDNFLVPILCIGETLEEKSDNNSKKIVKKQLEILNSVNNILIAYEPVWCIGSSITPTIDEISDISGYIKEFCQQRFAKIPKILYGGSVTNQNAEKILSIKNIDGILIGSASLNLDNFMEICNINI